MPNVKCGCSNCALHLHLHKLCEVDRIACRLLPQLRPGMQSS